MATAVEGLQGVVQVEVEAKVVEDETMKGQGLVELVVVVTGAAVMEEA